MRVSQVRAGTRCDTVLLLLLAGAAALPLTSYADSAEFESVSQFDELEGFDGLDEEEETLSESPTADDSSRVCEEPHNCTCQYTCERPEYHGQGFTQVRKCKRSGVENSEEYTFRKQVDFCCEPRKVICHRSGFLQRCSKDGLRVHTTRFACRDCYLRVSSRTATTKSSRYVSFDDGSTICFNDQKFAKLRSMSMDMYRLPSFKCCRTCRSGKWQKKRCSGKRKRNT